MHVQTSMAINSNTWVNELRQQTMESLLQSCFNILSLREKQRVSPDLDVDLEQKD